MKITKQGEGFVFDKKFCLGAEQIKNYIHLALEKGEAMKYGKQSHLIVDFPGEYDIQGILIRCMEVQGLLHYVLRVDGEFIAILQNQAVLEAEAFDVIDTWVCKSSDIKETIENLELEGDILVLDEITEE